MQLPTVRIAATVPGRQSVALAEPDTCVVTEIPVGGAFTNLALITDAVTRDVGADAAGW